jgi:hypothetical protein
MKKMLYSFLALSFVLGGFLVSGNLDKAHAVYYPDPMYNEYTDAQLEAGPTLAGTNDCLYVAGFQYGTEIFGDPYYGSNRNNYAGIIIQNTVSWKYSQGTCYQYPYHFATLSVGKVYEIGVKMKFTNPTVNQQLMVYLDKWNGSSWVEEAHTGNWATGNQGPITTQQSTNSLDSVGPGYVFFEKNYNGYITDGASKYRIRFSLPTAADWTQTSFYWFDYNVMM